MGGSVFTRPHSPRLFTSRSNFKGNPYFFSCGFLPFPSLKTPSFLWGFVTLPGFFSPPLPVLYGSISFDFLCFNYPYSIGCFPLKAVNIHTIWEKLSALKQFCLFCTILYVRKWGSWTLARTAKDFLCRLNRMAPPFHSQLVWKPKNTKTRETLFRAGFAWSVLGNLCRKLLLLWK